jgi:hypothetical protein
MKACLTAAGAENGEGAQRLGRGVLDAFGFSVAVSGRFDDGAIPFLSYGVKSKTG